LKTVLITGANGLIGRAAAARCRQEGLRTVGVVYPFEHPPEFDAVYPGVLQTPLADVFEKEEISAVVHGANHIGRNEFDINTGGTKLWAGQAADSGIAAQILLSSISAQEKAVSPYGRAKFHLEKWFFDKGYLSFRLGFVVGRGGLFGRLTHLVEKYPILPLPDGGRTWVYPTGLNSLSDLLCRSVRGDIDRPEKGFWRFFQPEPVFMADVIREIKTCLSARCHILNMPIGALLFAARILERIPLLKIGVSSNNILGMRQNNRNDFETDFERFGYPAESLSDLVRQALR
jgi:nucleoside-diphosphate-sugar epimerase